MLVQTIRSNARLKNLRGLVRRCAGSTNVATVVLYNCVPDLKYRIPWSAMWKPEAEYYLN